jgi:hypothetical protein
VLLYWHKLGPIQQHVATSAKRLKKEVPKALIDEPELRAGLELYYSAFLDLDRERSHGMGWTRIPWTAIAHYAAFYEFDEDQTERLFAHIRALDDAYLKQLDEDAEAKKGK